MSEHHKAFYTVEESEVGNLYYFAPLTHAAGPFKEQRRVEAVIDIDADGCLAGVELIDKMPAPPKVPPMTASADSRISDERLEQRLAHARHDAANQISNRYQREAQEEVDILTELRERRAQAVAAPKRDLSASEIERVIVQTEPADMTRKGDREWTRRMAEALEAALAAPPPAQPAFIETRNESAGFTEYVLEDETTVSRPVSGELLMSLDRTRVVGFRAYDAAGVTVTDAMLERAEVAWRASVAPTAKLMLRAALEAALTEPKP